MGWGSVYVYVCACDCACSCASVCVCAPCMFTACFRKEANGEDGLIHKGCLLCPIPIPFEEHRSRKGRSNIFTNDDPNNMDHYRSSGLVTNGSSFSLKLYN